MSATKTELRRIQPGPGAAHLGHVLRSLKMVQPVCQVESPMDGWGKTHPTTGPCQANISYGRSGELARWFETCPHDPYHEESVEERTEISESHFDDEGNEIIDSYQTKKIRHKRPRITQVPVSPAVMSTDGVRYAEERGFKRLEEFGIAPMCEFWNCWRQDVRKFRNGTFCSPIHAKLIKAQETGVMLAVGGESPNPEKRAEQLAALDV